LLDLLDILDGDQAITADVFIVDQQLFNAVLVQEGLAVR